MNTMLCALLSTVIENKPWPLCREGKKDRLESAGPQNQLILPLPFLLEEIGTWEEEMTFPNCDCHVSRAPIQNPCARPIVPRVGSMSQCLLYQLGAWEKCRFGGLVPKPTT